MLATAWACPGRYRHSSAAFKVNPPTAALLNSYTPAGLEEVIIPAGIPATSFELPKPGLGMNIPQPELMKLFEKTGMHVSG